MTFSKSGLRAVSAVSAIGIALTGLSPAKALVTHQSQNAAAAGKAILACPKRATTGSPNFAELDISTGVENKGKWWVLTPLATTYGLGVTPTAIPGNWAPNTNTSGWITTPAAASGKPPVGVYSYWLDFGIAFCPRSYKCTVSIDAEVAADDQGGYRTTANPWNTPAIVFGSGTTTAIKQSWPGLTGYHTIRFAVHNASLGETGLHVSGKLKRICL